MKISIIGFIFFSLLVSHYLSCNRIDKKNRSVVSEKFGTTIDLVDTLKYFRMGKGWVENPFQYGYKITTFLNADCSQCLYELLSWKDLIDEFGNDSISVLIYLKTTDINATEMFLYDIEFTYPVIIDTYGSFIKQNLIEDDKMFQTYLIDESNKILLVGNPIFSENIKELYSSTIKQLSRK